MRRFWLDFMHMLTLGWNSHVFCNGQPKAEKHTNKPKTAHSNMRHNYFQTRYAPEPEPLNKISCPALCCLKMVECCHTHVTSDGYFYLVTDLTLKQKFKVCDQLLQLNHNTKQFMAAMKQKCYSQDPPNTHTIAKSLPNNNKSILQR